MPTFIADINEIATASDIFASIIALHHPANPWETNIMLPEEIEAVNAFLLAYASNEAGQTFTWEFSLYEDPETLRQRFYIRGKMDNTAFAQSKQIDAPALPDNEVIGFIAADLKRMLEEAAYYASIGQLGPLSEIEVQSGG